MEKNFRLSYIAIHRVLEKEYQRNKDLLRKLEKENRPMLLNGHKMSDEELVEKLRSAGIEMDRKRLGELIDNHLSAEEISLTLMETDGEDESDWPWICLTILWERWFPDRPSLETIDDWMQEGYENFEENQIGESCRIWLKTWESILEIIDREGIKTIEEFDERFGGTQSLYNWSQDLEAELFNAEFHEERLQYAQEFIRRFGEESQLIKENMRRAIAESHYELGDKEKARKLLQEWVEKDQKWGWGWIAWSDSFYIYGKDEEPDYKEAERILKEALQVSGIRDQMELYRRLEDLYKETGQEEEQEKIHRKIKRIQKREQRAFPEIKPPTPFYQEFHKPLSSKAKKVGPNDPCPCGSGKKYKKCCS